MRAALGGALLLVAACSGVPVSSGVAGTDDPFLYLVLNEPTRDRENPGSGLRQHALLLTTGSPSDPVAFRSARRFVMRRVPDGRTFAWTALGVEGEQGSFPSASLDRPNWVLPAAGPAGQLGARDLVVGQSYEIEIDTEGKTVTGRVTIPDAFSVRVVVSGGDSTLVWPKVSGAAGYRVDSGGGPARLQTDTTFVLPAGAGAADVVVRALDPNLFGYTADASASRGGVGGGYGVFGASTLGRS